MDLLFGLEIFGAVLALVGAGVVLLSGRGDRRSWAVAALLVTTAAFLFRWAVEPGGAGGFALALVAAAPCGMAWIAARALFRADPAFTAAHAGVVGVIVGALVIARFAPGTISHSALTVSNLFSSTVILLALWESARGWRSDWAFREKALRYGFFVTYSAALAGGVLVLEGMDAPPRALVEAVQSAALATVAFYAGVAYLLRPVPPQADITAGRSRPEPDEALRTLAARIQAEVVEREACLTASLKVEDLARRLGERPYKISRAVTGVLGAANFNQYLNTQRIAHARRLLTETPDQSILVVALDSGFASLGPFNRAFKSVTGETPRDYRARRTGPSGLAAE